MRKLSLALAAAGSTIAFAVPAAAQYYPERPSAYGYGYNHWGEARELHERIERIEHQINNLDRRDAIREHSADKLRHEAERLERRLAQASRDGLNPYEAGDIRARITRLESKIQFAVADDGRRYERW